MNTALTILFLLLPAFPNFSGAWQAESPMPPIVVDTPTSTYRYMTDPELQQQVGLLRKISDPVTRSRIVTDIGNSYNPNIFTVLDAYLAEEKDPSVRADIISTLTSLPVQAAQPEDLPSLRINWKTAHPGEYEKSNRSSYLPEKMAAERFLSGKKFLAPAPGRLSEDFIALQMKYFNLRKSRAPEDVKQLERVIDSAEFTLFRLEAIRSLSAQPKLSANAVKKLQKIATENYVKRERNSQGEYDHNAIRAAACLALIEHEKEPAAAKALKEVERDWKRLFTAEKDPLLQEYYRQIQLHRKGQKVVPAPLPQRGSDRTFRFKK